MCERCGCQQFIKEGKEAVLKQVVDIIKELRLTPSNVDDYEATETVSGMIAPFGLKETNRVYQTAAWISSLHEDQPRVKERFLAHVAAFQDVFASLPAQGDPKQIATSYHQLEQLARELDETAVASLDAEIREAVQAVNRVHEDTTRRARLVERYGL